MKIPFLKAKQPHRNMIQIFLSGFAMGSADIVPGVSGGTIALIVGIYERLIDSIKLVSGKVLKLLLKGKIKEAIALTPFNFLIPLGLGLLTAIITLSRLLEWLLIEHPSYVWSFFFGLVLASIVLVGKRVKLWDFTAIGAFIGGTIFAYFVVGMTPVETPAHPLAFFLAGAIAICAMILPGISGSFLLIIMGKYSQILSAVNTGDVVTLGLVALGCIFGISIFSRVLSWMFEHYYNPVMAALAGIMLGSLRKIWPWKETVQTYIDSHGVEMPLVQNNILPNLDQAFLFSLLLGLIGMVLIFYMSKFDKKE